MAKNEINNPCTIKIGDKKINKNGVALVYLGISEATGSQLWIEEKFYQLGHRSSLKLKV